MPTASDFFLHIKEPNFELLICRGCKTGVQHLRTYLADQHSTRGKDARLILAEVQSRWPKVLQSVDDFTPPAYLSEALPLLAIESGFKCLIQSNRGQYTYVGLTEESLRMHWRTKHDH